MSAVGCEFIISYDEALEEKFALSANGVAFKDLAIFLSSRDDISSAMSSIIDPQSARSKSSIHRFKWKQANMAITIISSYPIVCFSCTQIWS